MPIQVKNERNNVCWGRIYHANRGSRRNFGDLFLTVTSKRLMLVKIMKIQLYKHNFTDTPLSLFTVLTTLSWDLWAPGTNNTGTHNKILPQM